MKKALIAFVALLAAACSSNREQEPTVVYRGYDNSGCNYYNGVCHRAAKKYVVESADGSEYRPTTTIVKTGEYKHCSDTLFGDPVPAPKFVANGPKVVTEQQPVQVRRVQYIRRIPAVEYVQQPVQYVQPVAQPVAVQQPCNGCQPTITQTREPVEVLFKKTTTKTVYEPKTTQEVSYEKEPYTGQLPCTNCVIPTPAPTVAPAPAPAPVPAPVQVQAQVVEAPTLTVPTSTVVTVQAPAPMPEAPLYTEITMDADEIK